MKQQVKTLRETLLLNVDVLGKLTMYLDDEPELHINDIIHLCNHNSWNLVELEPRVYGIYSNVEDSHVIFTTNEETGYVDNYENGRDPGYFPTAVHKGKIQLKH